jgi:hypothetical protein
MALVVFQKRVRKNNLRTSVDVDAGRQAPMPEYWKKQEQMLLKAMDRCWHLRTRRKLVHISSWLSGTAVPPFGGP